MLFIKEKKNIFSKTNNNREIEIKMKGTETENLKWKLNGSEGYFRNIIPSIVLYTFRALVKPLFCKNNNN